MANNVIIYTDGACRGNPGPGGWGALLCYDKQRKTLSGAVSETTNNRMELLAAIQALGALRKPCSVELYTDSQYVQKGITLWIIAWKKNKWCKSDKTPVKNADLWQALDRLTQIHVVTWRWVRGHSGHPENDIVDALATRAIDDYLAQQLKERVG